MTFEKVLLNNTFDTTGVHLGGVGGVFAPTLVELPPPPRSLKLCIYCSIKLCFIKHNSAALYHDSDLQSLGHSFQAFSNDLLLENFWPIYIKMF